MVSVIFPAHTHKNVSMTFCETSVVASNQQFKRVTMELNDSWFVSLTWWNTHFFVLFCFWYYPPYLHISTSHNNKIIQCFLHALFSLLKCVLFLPSTTVFSFFQRSSGLDAFYFNSPTDRFNLCPDDIQMKSIQYVLGYLKYCNQCSGIWCFRATLGWAHIVRLPALSKINKQVYK